MSNTEIVNSIYAAFQQGDIPAILSYLAEDVVWESAGPEKIAHAGVRKGRQNVPGFFEGLVKDHTEPELVITDVAAQGDSVAMFGHYTATMRTTGVRLTVPIGHLWKLRDGKVVRYLGLFDSGAVLNAM